MINFTATDPLLHEDMLHCHCLQEAFARDHQNQHTQTGVVTVPTLPVKSAIQPLTWQEMDIQHQSLSSALTRTWTVLYLTGTISLHGKTITVNRVKACIDGEEFSGGIPGRVRTAPHFAPIFKYPATDVGHDPPPLEWNDDVWKSRAHITFTAISLQSAKNCRTNYSMWLRFRTFPTRTGMLRMH